MSENTEYPPLYLVPPLEEENSSAMGGMPGDGIDGHSVNQPGSSTGEITQEMYTPDQESYIDTLDDNLGITNAERSARELVNQALVAEKERAPETDEQPGKGWLSMMREKHPNRLISMHKQLDEISTKRLTSTLTSLEEQLADPQRQTFASGIDKQDARQSAALIRENLSSRNDEPKDQAGDEQVTVGLSPASLQTRSSRLDQARKSLYEHRDAALELEEAPESDRAIHALSELIDQNRHSQWEEARKKARISAETSNQKPLQPRPEEISLDPGQSLEQAEDLYKDYQDQFNEYAKNGQYPEQDQVLHDNRIRAQLSRHIIDQNDNLSVEQLELHRKNLGSFLDDIHDYGAKAPNHISDTELNDVIKTFALANERLAREDIRFGNKGMDHRLHKKATKDVIRKQRERFAPLYAQLQPALKLEKNPEGRLVKSGLLPPYSPKPAGRFVEENTVNILAPFNPNLTGNIVEDIGRTPKKIGKAILAKIGIAPDKPPTANEAVIRPLDEDIYEQHMDRLKEQRNGLEIEQDVLRHRIESEGTNHLEANRLIEIQNGIKAIKQQERALWQGQRRAQQPVR